MKKKIYYIVMLLFAVATFGCSDDQVISDGEYSSDREFMTMFRTDHNTGKGDSDPYRCQVVADKVNDIQLYWYGVNDCAGYELKYALQANVANGAEWWERPENVIETFVFGPETTDFLLENLQYSTDYRFAIRTLSKKGEEFHSKWYGYGDGRQWAEYLGLTTGHRYDVPEVIVVNDISKTDFRVNFDRAQGSFTSTFDFEVDEAGNFVMQTLIVEASPTNPDAKIDDKWKNYTITPTDFANGYVYIDGLDENSVYVVNVKNNNIPTHWDAIYNTCVIRTDGEPGEPIFIEHYCDPNDTIPGAVAYNACRLDTILINYITDASLAEGTIFELEGGKAYYLVSNVSLCKGMTVRTKAGTGRATIYMNGISAVNGAPNVMNFMFGRQPQSGELGGINIKSIIFEDIDFDCPLARNFGQGSATGNYFINMYSNGMAVTLQSFEVRNCSFQRMVRGFVRTQGPNRKSFEKFVVEDCLFYNCGYYDNNGAGYAWIAGDATNVRSNIFNEMIFRGNTFYDSPRTALFNCSNANLNWAANIAFNITLENNTFVNFSTRATSRHLFNLQSLPGGSKITIKKNLFIQTRADNDTRNMNFTGMDIRRFNGSAVGTFDIEQNYSTNTHLTAGQIFTAGAFSATSNSAGRFPDFCINGRDELVVHLGENGIAPTDLMVDPNPKYPNDPIKMHSADNLNGLYFKNTPEVRNHEIYKLGIGDQRWSVNVTP